LSSRGPPRRAGFPACGGLHGIRWFVHARVGAAGPFRVWREGCEVLGKRRHAGVFLTGGFPGGCLPLSAPFGLAGGRGCRVACAGAQLCPCAGGGESRGVRKMLPSGGFLTGVPGSHPSCIARLARLGRGTALTWCPAGVAGLRCCLLAGLLGGRGFRHVAACTGSAGLCMHAWARLAPSVCGVRVVRC
jgi:hypothetical protein